MWGLGCMWLSLLSSLVLGMGIEVYRYMIVGLLCCMVEMSVVDGMCILSWWVSMFCLVRVVVSVCSGRLCCFFLM